MANICSEMMDCPSVMIGGPAYAMMLYEQVNGVPNQEGFILGTKQELRKEEISDAVINMEVRETQFYIVTCLPCPRIGMFYNNYGDINVDEIKKILGKRYEEMIGWYRLRRETRLCPTFRENRIHRHLAALSTIENDKFLFWIHTGNQEFSGATHIFNNIMLHHVHRNATWPRAKFHVLNLGGDASHTDGGFTYRTLPPPMLAAASDKVKDIINEPPGTLIEWAEKAQRRTQAYAKELMEKVEESEAEVGALKEQVAILKAQSAKLHFDSESEEEEDIELLTSTSDAPRTNGRASCSHHTFQYYRRNSEENRLLDGADVDTPDDEDLLGEEEEACALEESFQKEEPDDEMSREVSPSHVSESDDSPVKCDMRKMSLRNRRRLEEEEKPAPQNNHSKTLSPEAVDKPNDVESKECGEVISQEKPNNVNATNELANKLLNKLDSFKSRQNSGSPEKLKPSLPKKHEEVDITQSANDDKMETSDKDEDETERPNSQPTTKSRRKTPLRRLNRKRKHCESPQNSSDSDV